MTESIPFLEDQNLETPGLFPNPRSKTDAKILREVHTRYGLEYLDGLLVNIEDWEDLSDILYDNRGVQARFEQDDFGEDFEHGEPVDRKELLIYPDMSHLLGRSYGREAETLTELELDNGDPVIPRDLETDIQLLLDQVNTATDKGKRKLRLGPMAEFLRSRKTIQNLLEWQIESGASVVMTPSIPVTSMRDFLDQVDLIGDVFHTADAIQEGGLLSEEIPMMHTFSIKPSVLRRPEGGESTRSEQLVDLLKSHSPELVGIHIQNIDREHQDRIQSLLEVVSRTSNELSVPVFLLNVAEFGLAAFSHGTNVISGPIASFPYTRFSEGDPPRKGKYYHYEDLVAYTRERLMAMTRHSNYRFPCYCEACETFERVTNVSDDNEWNDFRRIHYLLTKNTEIKRVRESNKVLREALRDMFGNSQRSDLVSYL